MGCFLNQILKFDLFWMMVLSFKSKMIYCPICMTDVNQGIPCTQCSSHVCVDCAYLMLNVCIGCVECSPAKEVGIKMFMDCPCCRQSIDMWNEEFCSDQGMFDAKVVIAKQDKRFHWFTVKCKDSWETGSKLKFIHYVCPGHGRKCKDSRIKVAYPLSFR